METDGEGDAKKFRMSISSDTPYLRTDWDGEQYYEKLSHEPGGISDGRLKAGLPILFNHDRNAHLGRAKSFKIVDDGNGGKRCEVSDIKWSETDFAKEKRADAENGSLPDTSVGYRILDDGECTEVKDGIPVYSFKWEPHEGLQGICFRPRRTGNGQSGDRRRGVRGSGTNQTQVFGFDSRAVSNYVALITSITGTNPNVPLTALIVGTKAYEPS